MSETDKDYFFYIKWRDGTERLHRVGVLARINNIYYMKQYTGKEDEGNTLIEHGFNGIPSFIEDKLYKSEKALFDFFARRIIVSDTSDDICELLKKSLGKVLTDSFSLEEMTDQEAQGYRELLLEIDRIQTKIEQGEKNFLQEQK